MKSGHLFLCLSLSVLFSLSHQNPLFAANTNLLALIPLPVSISPLEGEFVCDNVTVLVTVNESEPKGFLEGYLLKALGERGIQIKTSDTSCSDENASHTIELLQDPGLKDLRSEGYRMRIGPNRIRIESRESAGLFYGIQTLLQLVDGSTRTDGVPRLAGMIITDYPRFNWRGLMMDCSRTFWPVEYLKETIDRLAALKMNVLHLHLTDDQGWRIEIKKYPGLTELGARFADHFNEPAERQGYYSQDEMRDLIEYASLRSVTIVPEIEMPGHCTAFLTVFPNLSCKGGPFEIFPYFKGEGVTTDVMCAGNEQLYPVIEGILDEVIALFPSPWIHIGGDEVPKASWKACPKCQARIKQEGLANEEELQSHFIKRVTAYVLSKGKTPMGWDEILEGGLAEKTAVMSWRGIEGGIQAAGMGHEVVMSPVTHCYFDYPTDQYNLQNVYSFEPIPSVLSGDSSKMILGAQGNMWTHIARTQEEVNRQVYPRLIGLSEVTWSPVDARNWESFSSRLAAHSVFSSW